MNEVATCPRCDGERQVYDARSGSSRDCPACAGKGVVWREESREALEQPSDEGKLELKGL
jgi:DnaJ-class molecular chaperone